MTVGPQQSLVIFDLDNTLVDRDLFFAEWTGALIRERHLDGEVSLAILRDADEDGAAPHTLFFERVQARLGLRGPIEDLIDEYWRDQMARYRCDQETIAGLRLLRQLGYKLGIATNGGARQIDKIKACGLDGLVDAVCVSRMVGYAKPDPRLFAAVAERAKPRWKTPGSWVTGRTRTSRERWRSVRKASGFGEERNGRKVDSSRPSSRRPRRTQFASS